MPRHSLPYFACADKWLVACIMGLLKRLETSALLNYDFYAPTQNRLVVSGRNAPEVVEVDISRLIAYAFWVTIESD